MTGFKGFQSVGGSIAGIEVSHMVRKGQPPPNGATAFQTFVSFRVLLCRAPSYSNPIRKFAMDAGPAKRLLSVHDQATVPFQSSRLSGCLKITKPAVGLSLCIRGLLPGVYSVSRAYVTRKVSRTTDRSPGSAEHMNNEVRNHPCGPSGTSKTGAVRM